MHKDNRHSAFIFTRMINRLGKKINAAIKKFDKYFEKVKTQKCVCEVSCKRNKCQCDIECQVMTRNEILEKLEKESKETEDNKSSESEDKKTTASEEKTVEIREFKKCSMRIRCCSVLCKCETKC